MTPKIKTLCSCLCLLAFVLSASITAQAQPTGGFDPKTLAQAPQGKPWEPAWGFWPKAPPAAWQQTHWGFVSQSKKGGVDVLFLGDSITKGWAGDGKEIWAQHYQPLKALNVGIGGDTTRQTLWRIENQALDGIQPKVVVLMIGVNNIFTGTGSDEEIAKGIGEVLKQIHAKCPKSKVLLFGILPLGNEGQSIRAKQINGMIAKFQSSSVRFVDLAGKFQGADGKIIANLYRSDQVHLAQPGYVVWDAAMKPVLDEMVK